MISSGIVFPTLRGCGSAGALGCAARPFKQAVESVVPKP
jgi:hypothetical protein